MPSTEKQFSGNFRGTQIEKGIILSNIIHLFTGVEGNMDYVGPKDQNVA